MKKWLFLLLFSTAFLLSCNKFREQTNENSLVQRIDHIVVYYDSRAEVDSMLVLFRDVLALPAWFEPGWRTPANNSNKFYNSGVYLGNVFLEFITLNVHSQPEAGFSPSSVYHGMAFTNKLENTRKVLDSLLISKTPSVYSFYCGNGQDTLFTNYIINALWTNQMIVFFCKYHPELLECKMSFDYGDYALLKDTEEHHSYAKELLAAADGGALGLKRVQKLILESDNYDEELELYDRLYMPVEREEGNTWKLNDYLDVELKEGDTRRISELVLETRSVRKTKEFLDGEGLSYTQVGDTLLLGIGENMGMALKIAEK